MARLTFTTDAATSARMKRIRQRNTKPELLLRALLWRHGIRFRTNNRDLPGTPDLANRSQDWAIFVHGCFWHGHVGCTRSRLPKRNLEVWREKIAQNKARDRRKEQQLAEQGFTVFTVWECEMQMLTTDARSRSRLILSLRQAHQPPHHRR
jgi:DNA mismatch endonuclease (patch repair protein)